MENSAPLPATAVSIDRHSQPWTIRLGHDFDLSSVADLQAALLEGLAAGANLSIDLAACGPSMPILQVLWAANNEAQAKGLAVTVAACDRLTRVLPFVGFQEFLGQRVPA